MDLFDFLGEDREARALDRLTIMLAGFEADSEIEQDLALERAIAYCRKEWGSYAAGLEALARRLEETPDHAVRSLQLREEGSEPGTLIRAIRLRRRRERGRAGEIEAVIAIYGGEDEAKAPTAFETVFITAAAHLSDGEADPFAPLDGWSLPWHDVPERLRRVVSEACPLPRTVSAARDECLRWEERLLHLEILYDCPGAGILPTACAARRRVVEDLWRKGLRAASLADLYARLDYWAARGGDDGAGYGVLQSDLDAVAAILGPRGGGETTKDRARRLKAANPHWSLARIGKELGISRQAVHKHLKQAAAPA
ncbi:HTH domain-containing protein [Magnetospirillum sp. SS-4]|uniref:HTH domain-containing protein n=1 Tax=Magnetospirillum sp. SS-4 TaxID=2681465 RepID=UPI00137E83D9|nr:HTH domain-containing protein [Magnetospirillum sp. SS-4]CAA7613809.1 conserved hypothetical protein [Magnetospirillum sp. SS-4]